MSFETTILMSSSRIKFGPGATHEVGYDMRQFDARRVMVVTDPVLAKLPPVRTVLESLEQNKIAYALYDRVRVEPSDESFRDAIALITHPYPVEGTGMIVPAFKS